MKFETIILKSLFVACFLVSALTVGTMIATPSNTATAVASHAPAAAAIHSAG